MDPLSITASAIGIATLAAQTAKAAYNIIDGLVEAPQVIARSRLVLLGTENTLNMLQETLKPSKDKQVELGSLLELIALDKTLSSTQEVCVQFNEKITEYTRRSSNTKFSNRDRILVNLHESKITSLKEELKVCQHTISLMIGTITL